MSNTASDSFQSSSFSFSSFDASMMARAFRLAEKGRYSTTPNPHVGCVIVDQNQKLVGEGFHLKAGLAHAEVNALAQAKELAKGACAYVTLEPCAHTNRTGPCAEALVKAGIKRVVIACTDPNPNVAGKGIAILKAAGVEVQSGLMQETGTRLNEHFFYRMQHNMPFVTVKLAASIDGKTALANGESKWITGADARRDVQHQRAQSCAILSGAGTVIADNPSLNVRAHELSSQVAEQFSWREQQPLRVVIDGQNKLDSASFLMLSDEAPTLVYNLEPNSKLNSTQLRQQVVAKQMQANRDYVDLRAVMLDLAKQQINRVWVEAGAQLTGVLFDMGLVNELIVYQAPMLLGQQARHLTNYNSPSYLNQALAGNIVDVRKIGADTRTIIRFNR